MKRFPSFLAGCLLFLMPGIRVQSGAQTTTTTFDFNTDPTAILDIRESFEGEPSPAWRPTGGVDNSGYIAITDANTGERRVIVFDDFNSGAVVSSFTFSCDLRTGGGTANPADGYSISFARANDPVITGGAFASSPGNEANLPEEGTQTGISIGLDEWDSGGGDVVGISVRVDNLLVNQTAMPTRNGAPDDATSLQTGPDSSPVDPETWDVPDHTFVNLTIKVDEDGTLDVIFKGRAILDNFQTSYFPSPGRIILAGRTGGSTANHHVDNIVITTTSATQPVVSTLDLTATDLTVEITDSATSVIDPAKPLTITMDGSPITVTREKTGNVTRLTRSIVLPELYPPGSHEFVITATDTNNNPVNLTPVAQTTPYTALDAAWAASAGQVNTSQAGFRARIHQLNFARYPGDSNFLPLPERQMAGGFFDSASGSIAANVAVAGPEADGTFLVPTVVNWDQDVSGIGSFPEDTEIPGIPGTTDSTDNIAGELFAWLDLPAGVTKLGVNSDDGFTVSFGANALDFFDRVKAGEFNGGRGAADTTFDIAAPVAGLYPVRILWWEGGGGANVEFFSVLGDGTKVLINDTATAGHIKAYYGGVPSVPAIHTVAPFPGITDNDPRHPLRVELTDGTATVNDATIALKINGEMVTPTIENAGGVTVVNYLPAGGYWASGSITNVELSFQDSAGGSRTETWSFGTGTFQILTIADGVPAASVSDPGYTARPWQVALLTGASGDVPTTYNESAEGVLAGIYGANIADLTGSDNGVFTFSGVLNWDQDLAGIGNFPDDSPIPGTPGAGDVNAIAAEVLTWLVFPAPGQYIMGVNSDDNFRVTLGHAGPTRHLFQLSGSASISGPQPSADGSRQFGSIAAPLTATLEADVVAADPITGLTPLNNAAAAAGKIVYIDRGGGDFSAKILNAQAAGAVGVIIGNNQVGYPIVMGGSGEGITIPAVMTTQDTGTAIKAALTAGDPLRASFGYDGTRRFGEYQGGRGSSDTAFVIDVRDAGAYPFRLIWQEGGGGANCEWFTILPDGTKVLINDATDARSIKAFRTSGPPPEVFFVTAVAVNPQNGDFSLTWQSTPGNNYRIESSPDLQVWTPVAASVPAEAGSSTTFAGNVAGIPTAPKLYFRVAKL